MTHSMRVDLECPWEGCDHTLTAEVDRESIHALTDDGCGHGEPLWGGLLQNVRLEKAIWRAVEEDGARRYDDEMSSRLDRIRDRG